MPTALGPLWARFGWACPAKHGHAERWPWHPTYRSWALGALVVRGGRSMRGGMRITVAVRIVAV